MFELLAVHALPPSFLNCFTWSCVPDKEAEAHLSEITRRVADVIPEIRWAEWTVRSTVRDVTDMRLNGEEKTKHTLAELVCTGQEISVQELNSLVLSPLFGLG
jgi:hypothetical protein